ncbi:hypothetical protein DFJ63DRAFT_28032 [Scheffersomyces coipomensis]|uniref:uncharacterized protein n=1 Tax=Scheffersomyces coipomensis TaxID=1788519 RepID=UPI00315C9AA8
MSSEPIKLDQFILAIKDLQQSNLESLKKQLINSLTKLIQTNNELYQETTSMKHQLSLNDTNELELKDLSTLYTETIDDNKIVIKEQKSRIKAIHDELVNRGTISYEDKIKSEAQIFNDLNSLDNSIPVDIKKDDEIQNDDDPNTDQEGVYL